MDGLDQARLRDDDEARKALRRFVVEAMSEMNKGNDLSGSLPLLNVYTVGVSIPLLARTVEKINISNYLNVA